MGSVLVTDDDKVVTQWAFTIFYIVIPLIEMCGCDWFKLRHVV